MDRAPEQNMNLEWKRVHRSLDDLFRLEVGNGYMEASYNQWTEALPLEPGAAAPRYVHYASKNMYAVAGVISSTPEFPYECLIDGDDVVFITGNGVLRRVVFPGNQPAPQAGQAGSTGWSHGAHHAGAAANAAADVVDPREDGVPAAPAGNPPPNGQGMPNPNYAQAFPEPSTPRSRSADEVFNLIGLAGISPTPSLEESSFLDYIQDTARVQSNDYESEEDLEGWKLGDTAADLRRKSTRLAAALHAYSAIGSAPTTRRPAPHPEFAPGGMLSNESTATASSSGPATAKASTSSADALPSNIIDLSVDSDAGGSSEPRSQARAAEFQIFDKNGRLRDANGNYRAKYHPSSKPYLSPEAKRSAHILTARPKVSKKRKAKPAQVGASQADA